MTNVYFFILGISIGSFLNVLIDRLPKGKSINGRSQCDYCKKKLSGWDLVPVISFLVLGGKCRYCHKKLSWQYLLVEIITGIIFLFVWKTVFLEDSLLRRVSLLGTTSCLIVIFFSDLKYHIIPDSIQIVFFIFSFLFHILSLGFISNLGFRILDFLWAGFIVMLPILFLWCVTRGRGMGFGDVKLAFNIGFLLGIKAGLLSLYFAFIVGAVIGLFLILMKKSKLKSKIAFGPFLVIGTATMLLFENKIFEIIKQVYGF